MDGVSRSSHLRFRQPGAIFVAAALATVGALPLAGQSWYLAPIILVPLLLAVWAWRSGTDVGRDALRVRALAGQRVVPWSHVASLAPDAKGRVSALLVDGNVLRLPGVNARDLPVIVAATGHSIEHPADEQPNPGPGDPARASEDHPGPAEDPASVGEDPASADEDRPTRPAPQ
jgi:hypothetical protein